MKATVIASLLSLYFLKQKFVLRQYIKINSLQYGSILLW